MKKRLAVRAIIFKNGKLLSIRIKHQNSDKVNDYWCTIGGGVDEHEGLIDALKREVIEETGINPAIGDLLYIQQFNYEDCDHLEFFFNITNIDDFDSVELDKTTHGAAEIHAIEYLDPSTTHLLPEFLTKTNIAQDIESGRTKLFNYF